MPRRRRFQWIDSVSTTPTAIAGAAAPGTIITQVVITEAEMENLGGGATLIRTVGSVWLSATAGRPVVTGALYLQENYAGSVPPTDWGINDTWQRKELLGSWMYWSRVGVGEDVTREWKVDLRAKRKLTQGQSLDFIFQNHSVATNDVEIVAHFRCLLMLP